MPISEIHRYYREMTHADMPASTMNRAQSSKDTIVPREKVSITAQLTGGEGHGVMSLSSDNRDRILCAFFLRSMLSHREMSFTTCRNVALQLSVAKNNALILIVNLKFNRNKIQPINFIYEEVMKPLKCINVHFNVLW